MVPLVPPQPSNGTLVAAIHGGFRLAPACGGRKSPALLAANPLGMVPTLLDETTGKAVGESLVCIQLIDEIAAANGGSANPNPNPNPKT